MIRNILLFFVLLFLVSCSNTHISVNQATITNIITPSFIVTPTLSAEKVITTELPTSINTNDNFLEICNSIGNNLKTDDWKMYASDTYKIALKYPPNWYITDIGDPKGNFGEATLFLAYSPIEIITEADEIEGGSFDISVYKSRGDAKTIAINSIKWSGGNICKYYHNQLTGILAESHRNVEDWRELFIQLDSNVIGILTIANIQKPDMVKILDQVLLSVTILD